MKDEPRKERGSETEINEDEPRFTLGIEEHLNTKFGGSPQSLSEFPDEAEYKFQISDLKRRLKETNEFIAQQRVKYLKEINSLKDKCSLGSQVKYQGYKFMEVKYYDSTELVDTNVRKLINEKVDHMRESFENQLLEFE
jgi:hypothetical protein